MRQIAILFITIVVLGINIHLQIEASKLRDRAAILMVEAYRSQLDASNNVVKIANLMAQQMEQLPLVFTMEITNIPMTNFFQLETNMTTTNQADILLDRPQFPYASKPTGNKELKTTPLDKI